MFSSSFELIRLYNLKTASLDIIYLGFSSSFELIRLYNVVTVVAVVAGSVVFKLFRAYKVI